MTMFSVYRILYVLLGTFLGAVAGYVFARYFVMLFGIVLHVYFPRHYSFDHVMAVLLNTRGWLRPLLSVAFAAGAAFACYRFCRRAEPPDRRHDLRSGRGH
jgi:hypothetical protein